MSVASDFAAWLQADALFVKSTPASAATWANRAKDSTIKSPLAYKPDAQAEADYQAAFLAGPIARDTHIVPGQRSELIGLTILIQSDRLGYEGAGATVFVIGAEEAQSGNTTTLTVIRKL